MLGSDAIHAARRAHPLQVGRLWLGRNIKGGPLEPMPVKGKNSHVELSVQAAYDANNAFFRFQWKSKGKAGIE